jgi:hypothetical protein
VLKAAETLVELRLPANNLSAIPNGIADLVNLRILDVSFNQISKVSKKFGALRNVREVDMSCNAIKALPAEFGLAKSIRVLKLGSNQFREFPVTVLSLWNLQKLYIEGNPEILSLAPQIGNMPRLKTLVISNCGLTSLHENMCKLRKLEALDISVNKISSVPDAFSDLSRLRTIDMSFNDFEEVPRRVRKLPRLKRLIAAGNKKKLDSILPDISESSESDDDDDPEVEAITKKKNSGSKKSSAKDEKDKKSSRRKKKKDDDEDDEDDDDEDDEDARAKERAARKKEREKDPKEQERRDRRKRRRDAMLRDRPSQILDKLYLGDVNSAKNRHYLKEVGVTHILTLLEAECTFWPEEFTYKTIHISDIEKANLAQHFDSTHKYISGAIKDGKSVLVHCFAGISRSASVVCAYLMRELSISADEAIKFVQGKREIVFPNLGFQQQLREYEDKLKKGKK